MKSQHNKKEKKIDNILSQTQGPNCSITDIDINDLSNVDHLEKVVLDFASLIERI